MPNGQSSTKKGSSPIINTKQIKAELKKIANIPSAIKKARAKSIKANKDRANKADRDSINAMLKKN